MARQIPFRGSRFRKTHGVGVYQMLPLPSSKSLSPGIKRVKLLQKNPRILHVTFPFKNRSTNI